MKVLIDLRPLETGNRYRGFGYYIENSVKALIASKSQIDFLFLTYSTDNPLYDSQNQSAYIFIRKPTLHPRLYWIWDQLLLSRIIKRIHPDTYVSLDMNLPLLLTWQKRIKTIVTIHDLIPIIFAKEYNLPLDRWLEYKTKYYSASKADKVLTISNHSKQDITKYLNVKSENISVIYEAVSADFKPISQMEQLKVRAKYTGKMPYLLTVGDYYGIDPRKNYCQAVELLSKLQSDPTCQNLCLIFAGKCGGKDNEYSKITTLTNQLKLTKKIIFTDYISQDELVKLFGAADCYLHLSSYEGFGLPILQAMRCGIPVVAANNSSVPEIAGDAAELFKTGNIDDLLKAFIKIMSNKQKYIDLGFENVKRFSWETAARQVVDLIK